RDGMPVEADLAGLPELRVDPLDEDAARALLHESACDLPDDLQARILREAAGNPLALIELPRAVARAGEVPPTEPLPLTERLERTVAARLGELSLDARTLLLLAALDAGSRGELCRAAELMLGRPVAQGSWDAIASAGLGNLAGGQFRFRHPLVTSAVHQAASAEARQRAHDVLARALDGDPDRAVWHAAAAASSSDEQVASRLEEA